MHQQALALLRSTSQVDSTGKIENGKKTGRRRENIVGVQKWIAIWICESFKLKGHDASKYHQIWLIECGQKKKICATECGKKNVSMNASWSETVTGVQRDFAEKSWSLQIMRFQESSRRVDVACWKFSNAIVHSDLYKRICWPLYQRCASFFFWCAGRF